MSSLRHSSSRIWNLQYLKRYFLSVIAAIVKNAQFLYGTWNVMVPPPLFKMSTKYLFEIGEKNVLLQFPIFVLGCKKIFSIVYIVCTDKYVLNGTNPFYQNWYIQQKLPQAVQKVFNPEGNTALEKTLFTVSCLEINLR